MIRLTGVSFGYRTGDEVLRGVDLELGEGLSLVVGPNGCGKSTLLKIVSGVELPASGSVTVDGHDLWREEVAARQRLAYLPEHPDLTPYATVHEILELVCGLRRQPKAAAGEALAWVGLAGLGDRTVRELSKGQRRRATLAAARIGAPDRLILDEPLEGMDRRFRVDLLRWIAGRREQGALLVVVSHEVEKFAALADRAVTVCDGRCLSLDLRTMPEEARLAELDRLAVAEGRPSL